MAAYDERATVLQRVRMSDDRHFVARPRRSAALCIHASQNWLQFGLT